MSYGRILSRLLNTPLAISQDKLDIITSNVTLKLLAGEQVSSIKADVMSMPGISEDTSPEVAIIDVFDSLVTRNGAGDSGSTSYSSIERQIQYALSNEVSHIVFNIGSPGGEVEGLFGLTDYIASLPSSYGVETLAVASGNMTSAAYMIGAACQKTVATASSMVGSIGVIMTLLDVTAADKKDGYSYTIMRSKTDKALINPHEVLSKSAIAKATKMLAELDMIMNDTVVSYRSNLSVEDIVSMKGDTFLGEEALKLGLIDEVVTSFQEALDGLIASSNTKTTTQPKGVHMTTIPATLSAEEVAKLQADLAAAQSQLAMASANAMQAEQTRFNEILTAATVLGIPNANAVAQNYFTTGMTADMAKQNMTILKQSIQLANPSPSLNALDPSITSSILGSETSPVLSFEDQLANRIESRSKVKFDCAEDASEFEAAEALFSLIK